MDTDGCFHSFKADRPWNWTRSLSTVYAHGNPDGNCLGICSILHDYLQKHIYRYEGWKAYINTVKWKPNLTRLYQFQYRLIRVHRLSNQNHYSFTATQLLVSVDFITIIRLSNKKILKRQISYKEYISFAFVRSQKLRSSI